MRLANLRAYHERTRPHPRPLAQPARPDLPPLGVVLADDDGGRVQCHVCGQWRVALGPHARLAHGLSADAYRAAFDLGRHTSLAAPNYGAIRRRIALAGGVGEHLPLRPGRPRGVADRLSGRIARSAAHTR